MNEFEMTGNRTYVQQHGFFPWRRYFARNLDLSIFMALVGSVLTVGFDVIILNHSELESYLMVTIPSIILMLFIEPLLISKYGTTPSKALLGIKILDANGDKLSYGDALSRTMGALFKSYAFALALPSFITCIIAFRRLRRLEPMSYDEDVSVEVKPVGGGRYFAYILSSLALVSILVVASLTMFLPKNQGELSKEEYIENFNHYMDVYAVDVASLDSNGVLNSSDLFAETNIQFEFSDENGTITAVEFEASDRGDGLHNVYVAVATMAFDSSANFEEVINRLYLDEIMAHHEGEFSLSERDFTMEFYIAEGSGMYKIQRVS